MSKLTRKEKIAQQKERAPFSEKEIKKQEEKNLKVKRWLGIILAIVAFAVYATSLNNKYVLDDFGLIHDNTQVKRGISAVPEIFTKSYRYGMNITDHELYRPLSKAMFAVEWGISPNNPSLSHWVNVLFFALTCLVMFRVFTRYFKGEMLIPFLTVLLFAVHPIHAEAVANIKSRDEILTLLLCMLAAGSFHRWITGNQTKYLVSGVLCYFVALFSKESAITFLAAFPLMFYFFTDATRRHYVNSLVPMVLLTGVFLLIRRKVLGPFSAPVPFLDNFISGQDGFLNQRVNAIYMLGYYLKTLAYPDVLISDGSYNHFKAVTISNWKFIVSALVLLAGVIWTIRGFKTKEKSSFAIAFFLVTVSLVSNIFILIGTCYGERLMFVPSIGFCMLIAIMITSVLKSDLAAKASDTIDSFLVTPTVDTVSSFFSINKNSIAIIAVLCIPLSIQAYIRSNEWEDNTTLYNTDLKKVPDSAHLLFYLANHVTTEDYIEELPDSSAKLKSRMLGINYASRAIMIYPEYSEAYQRRAYIYFELNKYGQAEKDYKKSLELNPTNPVTNNNYGHLLFNMNRFEEARGFFETAVRYNPNYAHALNNLASSYGVFANAEQEAIPKDPANAETHKKNADELYQKAIYYFLESIKADPEFGEPYRLVAITYGFLGQKDLEDKYNALYQQVMSAKKSNAKN